MKVIAQTLTKQKIEVEVADDATIMGLKELLESQHDFADGVKLVFKGQVLPLDTTKLTDKGIKDGDNIVVVGKKKAAGAPPPAPAAPAPTPAPAPASTPTQPDPTPAPPAPAPEPPAGGDGGQEQEGGGSGGASEETVLNLMAATGKDKAMVEKALRAAFGNADRAAEYLITGNIPDLEAGGGGGGPGGGGMPGLPPELANMSPQQLQQLLQVMAAQGQVSPQAVQALAALAQAQQGGGGGGGGGDGGGESGPGGSSGGSELEQAIAQHIRPEEFNMLRQQLMQNPQALPQIMMVIRDKSPELFEIIQANSPEFLRLIQQGLPGSGGGGPPPGATVVHVSAEDKPVIERLAAMFQCPVERALEAYMACDKNEEAAANMLCGWLDD